MARNKHPEQTLEQILSVSAKLFTEKSYEKTSIQDIIDALGMSKGAIYHHFKSKEEILEAVMDQQFSYAAEMLNHLIVNTEAPNARLKLIQILENVLADPKAHTLDKVLSHQIKNPQFVLTGMKNGVEKDAPIIAGIMIQGQEDGSITTEFPYECAEVFMLLINIWINPTLFRRNRAETISRLTFLQQMMRSLGADIITDQLLQKVTEHHASIGGYQ
ncbi:TetR/AcrR family transcriptional regulator [Paenibacillus apis]|uniref:TetR family transcriptional regulator n=1 Tax=Paenibacillus apis TaxID=1792174 RepID=A0A919Y3I1_9BACL|nr:TetR/AcrR family transcriptional regulator [Paenibacillus apis]GIO41482.1 TetR family transcriptional regulator [Paenibacillus apis]